MKFSLNTILLSLSTSALAIALPGGTTDKTPAGYGNPSGDQCYAYTYSYTSSGWTEYPTTICKTSSIPYTKTVTVSKTIETLVPSSYVTTIYTNIPSTTVEEVCETTTGVDVVTTNVVEQVKSSWATVVPVVTSTCKAGGSGYGSGGY